jgi:porphobilinogen synthase
MHHSFRFRRLRANSSLRALVKETHLRVSDLIQPIFVEELINEPVEIASMPGVFRYPESQLSDRVTALWNKGIRSIILFGVSHHKDDIGSETWNENGLLSRMVRIAKAAQPKMIVICDVCFCEYTTHGHCGVIHHDDVDNDSTLLNLSKQAVCVAKAGADIIAPSGMMDGMVLSIRNALDLHSFQNTPIMSYSTKFSSAFYGPFRDAVESNFKGSRDTYQLNPANGREALAESLLDEQEGADILMVKPGIAYLDILANIRQNTSRTLAVYQVSGEYAMIKVSAQAGVIDEQAVVLESLIAFKRAGADLIISYFSEDVIGYLQSNEHSSK